MKKSNTPSKKEGKIPINESTRKQRGYKSVDELIKTPKYKKNKDSYKSNAKKRLYNLYRYYDAILNRHIQKINGARNLSLSERRDLNHTITNMRFGIKYASQKGFVDDAYYNCVKEKLRDITLFLRKLESENYNIGKYIREYGFHPVFLPEDKFIDTGSIKIVAAVQSFDEYIASCLTGQKK